MYVLKYNLLKQTFYHKDINRLSNSNSLVLRSTGNINEAKKFTSISEIDAYRSEFYDLFTSEFDKYKIEEVS